MNRREALKALGAMTVGALVPKAKPVESREITDTDFWKDAAWRQVALTNRALQIAQEWMNRAQTAEAANAGLYDKASDLAVEAAYWQRLADFFDETAGAWERYARRLEDTLHTWQDGNLTVEIDGEWTNAPRIIWTVAGSDEFTDGTTTGTLDEVLDA